MMYHKHIAVFVGLGIDAFYQAPTMPDYPQLTKPMYRTPDESEMTEKEIAQAEASEKAYTDAFTAYDNASKIYNRNVSIISMIFAIVILSASVMFAKSLGIIADGLILGGVLTLTYSIIRGFSADDEMFRFAVVAIGLVVTVTLGYIKFLKPAQYKDAGPSKGEQVTSK